MSKDPRTFKVDQPPLKGEDIGAWQQAFNSQMKAWNIDYRVKVDDVYGLSTRSATATWMYALGIEQDAMADGLTPELRSKMRGRKLTPAEKRRFTLRRVWRARLRTRYAKGAKVARPVNKITADSWGYHPGVHDGIDVCCPPDATIYAMCKSRVIDVRSGGWWGKAPSGDVRKGDGVIQLEVLESIGPFKKGMHIGYGHAEKATVKEGQIVEAGQAIGHAGLAVAWHIHLMVNDGQTSKGIGTRDPRPLLRYAVRHG
jgi:murein DD-endopeptidase MepM/ murein hydrolase activator NlpD